jgi:hypothetical protein
MHRCVYKLTETLKEMMLTSHCLGFSPILILPTYLNYDELNFFLRTFMCSFSSIFCSNEQMSLAHCRISDSFNSVVVCSNISHEGCFLRIFFMKKMLEATKQRLEYLYMRKSNRQISIRYLAKK